MDQNPENNSLDNLAWLCLNHHDQYDSQTRQSKGLTEAEFRHYRADLYAFNEAARQALEPSAAYSVLTSDAMAVARHLNTLSVHGHKFDPQLVVADLPAALGLTSEEIALAIDELSELGLLETNGYGDIIRATNRLFWETDAIFTEHDPVLDAQNVARAVVAFSHDFPLSSELAEALGWTARRINPAITYLVEAGVVRERPAMGSAPFWLYGVVRNLKTRRYVRDLGPDPDAA